MIKTTLKEIKKYRTENNDLTYDRNPENKLPINRARQIAYSVGVYGINGLLLQDMVSGVFFVITVRTSTLFKYL